MLPFTALRTGVRLVGALAAGGLATLRRPFSASRTYRATSPELLLSLVHFNDVYHLLPRKSEPVGGVSRFYTKLKELEKENDAFITFGGDCFSPGQMATVMRGDHMVPLFKRFGIVCAVVGNHDFDHGADTLTELVAKTEMDWLLTNAVDPRGNQIAKTKRTKIFSWHGVNVGVMGLIESEWISTLRNERDGIVYSDFIDVARHTAKELRDNGAEFVIALTHMRVHNDEKLAMADTGVDLILGGHDHFYQAKTINNTHIVKGGTDFRDLTLVKVYKEKVNGKRLVQSEHITVTSDIPENPEIAAIVNDIETRCQKNLSRVVGFTTTPLDLTATGTRQQESNVGDLVCDLMCREYKADATIINGGSFRSDSIVAPGPISLAVLTEMFPYDSDIIVPVALTGQELLEVLEHGYSAYPAHEGRFLQVGGLKIQFDASRPPMNRVTDVRVNGKLLSMTETYRVALSSYMLNGGDGFEMLKVKKPLMPVDEAAPIITVLRKRMEKLRNISPISGTGLDKFLPISPNRDGRIKIINGVPEVDPARVFEEMQKSVFV